MVKIGNKIVSAQVVKEDKPVIEEPKPAVKKKRPSVLLGETHKLVNHAKEYNLYVTVNYLEDEPFEVFIDSSHTDSVEFIKGIARLSSAMLREPQFDLEFVAKELMKIHSDQGYHTGKKGGFVAGIVQHIGKTLLYIHKKGRKAPENDSKPSEEQTNTNTKVKSEKAPEPVQKQGEPCPECGEIMTKLDGCYTCVEGCGYSKCS